MSTRKKTADELLKAAQEAEARARKLRAQAKKATQAEEAKLNVEILSAMHEWLDTFPTDKRKEWSEMPAYFRKQAAQNRQRYEVGNEQQQNDRFAVGGAGESPAERPF